MPTLKLYKKTEDCKFPEPCACYDCKLYGNIKRVAYGVDQDVYTKLRNQCKGLDEHEDTHE